MEFYRLITTLSVFWLLYSNSVISTANRAADPKEIIGFMGRFEISPKYDVKELKNVHVGWFPQRLDHFNPENNVTWNQQYFLNKVFYQEGGPACINIGGEAPANHGWILVGEMFDHCSSLNAVMYILEHRFYGHSHPLPDASDENLKYLTIAQALGDMEYFMGSMRAGEHQLMTAEVIIVYGGSYAGTLAAYSRQNVTNFDTRPDMAIASSAPLNWKYDFKEYYPVIGTVLLASSYDCYATIKNGMQYLEDVLKSSECLEGDSCMDLLSPLIMCQPINASNTLDVQYLSLAITELFSGIIQYNGLADVTADDICQIVSRMDPVLTDYEKLATTVNFMLNYVYEADCLYSEFDGFCLYNREYKWSSHSVRNGYRTWTWTVCNEVASFQTTGSPNQPFGNNVPVEAYVAFCQCVFGDKYDASFIQSAVDNHLKTYGGYDVPRDNIFYLNGAFDPWAPLGVREYSQMGPAIFTPEDNYEDSREFIVIEGASHCNDLMPFTEKDSSSLLNARDSVFRFISTHLEWLA